MDIVNRLKSNKISKDGSLECLDSVNPIVLYEAITCIVKNHITDKVIVDKSREQIRRGSWKKNW